jgi:hypothetical protein
MTVLAAGEQGCCCIWFADPARLEHGNFDPDAVEFIARPARLVPMDLWSRSPQALAERVQHRA